MRKLVCRSLLALFTMAAAAPIAAAQDSAKVAPPKVGRILGIFDDATSQPLEDVEVIDRLGGTVLRTKQSGLVGLALFQSQHDSAVVTLRKIGYADTTFLVMLGVADTVPKQAFMRHVTALDSVVVTARETEHFPLHLRDFEMRLNSLKATGGKAAGPAELRKNDGRLLYDFLLSKGITNSGRCNRVGVYLDGAPYRPQTITRGSPGIPDEHVDEYDAVVFYTQAEMPQEFRRTGGGCAALLLYSRGR